MVPGGSRSQVVMDTLCNRLCLSWAPPSSGTIPHAHLLLMGLIAELWHAKHACGAPWVRKCGNLPIRENLVIT